MEGSKKESNIDDYIKLLQILNSRNPSEIKKTLGAIDKNE